jgi:hypothetical protein
MKSQSRTRLGVSIRWVRAAAFLTPLLTACGADDSSQTAVGSDTQDLAQLDAANARAALTRKSEVQSYLERTYFSRFNVLATSEGPMGEVVDWVDPHQLDPEFDKRTPPPSNAPSALDSPKRAASVGAPTPVSPGDDISALWAALAKKAPRGSVPVIRQNFDHYVSGSSGKPSVEEFVLSQAKPDPVDPASPQPTGQSRLYTSRAHTLSNIGTQGWIQYVNPAQVPATSAFSLTQLASLCWGSGGTATLEAIEVGLQKFPGKYGDSNLHFFTYFRTRGGALGHQVGGYNLEYRGFVQQPNAFPPGAIVPNPPAGQARQRRLRTTLWNGAWWVQDYLGPTTYTWLGYYPIGNGEGQVPFDLIDTEACATHWYGEVYDATPTSWHDGDLGNGVYGTWAGSLQFLEMIIERSAGNVWFDGLGTTTDPACYSMSALSNNGTTNWFNFGGPGGDGAGCN